MADDGGRAALPPWCTLVRADNPGPMTLEGTNTYLLADRLERARGGGMVVVDPGPLLPAHLEAVAAAGPVAEVWLTHGHPDHAEGAARFHQLTGAPVRASDPAHCYGGGAPLRDGERLGAGGLAVRVVATPGHTADSLTFAVDDAAEPALLTGDTILGRGTTVVAWPEGRLADYLGSLAALRDLVPGADGPSRGPVDRRWRLLPGHGPIGADAGAAATAYLAHREQRLEQVRAALAAGAQGAGEVVALVYADVDRSLWPAAELSVRATLDYLGHAG